MAKPSLELRIKTANGSWAFAPPVWAKNHRLKPLMATVKGKEEHHPEGVYFIRYALNGKRHRMNAGSDAPTAANLLERQDVLLRQHALGLPSPLLPPPPPLPTQDAPKRVPWEEATRKYIFDTEKGKRKKTAAAYRSMLEEFHLACPVTYVDKVTKEHIFTYRDAIFAKGNSPRTAFNRMKQLTTFLRKNKLVVLEKGDYPAFTRKKAQAYSRNDIQGLFQHFTAADRLIFETFLGSGLRDQELMYLGMKDLIAADGILQVREKPDVGFFIKDWEERDVPIADDLVRKLVAHRDAYPGRRFLFVTSKGKPDGHLLRKLKRTALRAGLNCGQCSTKKGLSCANRAVCKVWDLHKFRRTFASWHHDAGVSARTLMDWLGHSDLQTTEKYLAAADIRSAETRRKVNKTFSVLAS